MGLMKEPRYENRKLLDIARGMVCSGCGADDGTIVMAHSNASEHGKGKGLKSHDCFVAALCFRCHTWLDTAIQPLHYLNTPFRTWYPVEKDEFFRRAHDATMLYLWRSAKIKVA